jgi:hypothetical protein
MNREMRSTRVILANPISPSNKTEFLRELAERVPGLGGAAKEVRAIPRGSNPESVSHDADESKFN